MRPRRRSRWTARALRRRGGSYLFGRLIAQPPPTHSKRSNERSRPIAERRTRAHQTGPGAGVVGWGGGVGVAGVEISHPRAVSSAALAFIPLVCGGGSRGSCVRCGPYAGCCRRSAWSGWFASTRDARWRGLLD